MGALEWVRGIFQLESLSPSQIKSLEAECLKASVGTLGRKLILPSLRDQTRAHDVAVLLPIVQINVHILREE